MHIHIYIHIYIYIYICPQGPGKGAVELLEEGRQLLLEPGLLQLGLLLLVLGGG